MQTEQNQPSDAGQGGEELKAKAPRRPLLTGRMWRRGKRIKSAYQRGPSTNNRKETAGRLYTKQRIVIMAPVIENGKPVVGLDGKPIKRPTGEIRIIHHLKTPNK